MISLVIPAYNEEGAIRETIETAERVFSENGLAPHEIIVVDDGSTDRTGELAEAAGAVVVRHPHNIGYGRSIKDGIEAARFDVVAICDADGTYPIDRLPALLLEMKKGFNMVVGARYGAHYRESWLKRPLRRALRFMVEFSTGRKIPDINSGLRVFFKPEASAHFPHLCNTFSFTTSLTLAYMLTGKFVTYLPIPYNARVGRTKVRLFRDSLRTMQYIVQAVLYYNPIKMFIIISGLTMLMTAIAAVVVLFFSPTAALWLSAGGFMTAVLVFSLGLLGEMLRQIMDK